MLATIKEYACYAVKHYNQSTESSQTRWQSQSDMQFEDSGKLFQNGFIKELHLHKSHSYNT